MKKTLAAVAVLGAFAGSAIAADVTLYGVVDMGLNYSHVDMDGAADDLDSFTMESGQQSGSRWGLKGTEDLGNGLTVGFVLENGFTADDGADGGDAMFDRESMLFLEGGFGKLAFGRIGSFNQGQGSFSKIGMLTPFGTSFGDYAAQAGNIFASSRTVLIMIFPAQWAYFFSAIITNTVFSLRILGNNTLQALTKGTW